MDPTEARLLEQALTRYERSRLKTALLAEAPSLLLPLIAFVVGGRLAPSIGLGFVLWAGIVALALTALIGGQVDVMCDQTTNTTGQIEGGRVKAFAVTTAKRLSSHKLLKDYPSLQEMGLKGFNLSIWHAMYAPKGTPADVQKKLNDALLVALKDPDFIKKQNELGAIVVTDNRVTPAGHKAFVASEITKLKAAIDAAGEFAD